MLLLAAFTFQWPSQHDLLGQAATYPFARVLVLHVTARRFHLMLYRPADLLENLYNMFEFRALYVHSNILWCAGESPRVVVSSQATVEHSGTVSGIHEAGASSCGSDIGREDAEKCPRKRHLVSTSCALSLKQAW